MLTRRGFGAVCLASAAQAQTPRRLRRAESFFGLHFDLHPSDTDTALGKDVTENMVERLVTRVRPDYVQYDSKGHAGWLGWKSDVGPSAPGIVNDSLAVWRKITARHDIALYIHFSGVWDTQAVRRHPEWARVPADGKPEDRQTSTFGPYVDKLMIPQLREAATRYALDGAWVDGECWATNPDWTPAAVESFRQATGKAAPRDPKDAGWLEWLEFQREQFRKYLKHYCDEIHRTHPQFQICSNWLYSTFVPERPILPVDFLSGDYLGNASISTARVEARYLAQTGKPWDLMAWGFQQADSNSVGHIHKPAVQLEQEAAVVLAQGGGFQVYYQPSRSGHFEDSHVEVMAKLAAFCRARQSVSHKTESVPQIGVVFSKESLYAASNKLFGGWGRAINPVRGWLDALVECHYSADVLPDWKLEEVLQLYPLVVLPEWTAPGERVHETLRGWVEKGGRLVVSGAANARVWAAAMGASGSGDARDVAAFLGGGEVLGNAKGVWQDVTPGAATVLERRYGALDSRGDGAPAALAAKVGRGEVVLIPGPIGSVFAATHAPAIRQFVQRIVAPRFEPMIAVEAPPPIEFALRWKGERLLAHLVNAAGMQVAGDYAALDYVPEAGPVRLRFQARSAPADVMLLPDNTKLAVQRAARGWMVEIPKVAIHAVVSLPRAAFS